MPAPSPAPLSPSPAPPTQLKALELHERGFTILRTLLSPPYITGTLLPAAEKNFAAAFAHLSASHQIPANPEPPGTALPVSGTYPLGHGAANGFTEIVRRSNGRYEQTYGMSESPFTDGLVDGNTVLREVLEGVFEGKEYGVIGRSLVTSLPGSTGEE